MNPRPAGPRTPDATADPAPPVRVQGLAYASGERMIVDEYQAGDRIGEKYVLVRELGRGGMATVWAAQDEVLDVPVAIKMVHSGVVPKAHVQRMLTEARAAARISHPSIVRVQEFGQTAAGDPFLVVELLRGEDLASTFTRRGRLSPTEAVRVLLPVMEAVCVAHAAGVVHRDIKPSNIFLTRTSGGGVRPKLLDFGLARVLHDDAVRVTREGSALGSPAYMSPEQARGEEVDARSDIWSLGVVAYEAITGRLPFEGTNFLAMIRAITEEPARPTTDFAAGDSLLWEVIRRALCRQREERWQTMREMGEALAGWAIANDVTEDITSASIRAVWLTRSAGTSLLGSGSFDLDLSVPPRTAGDAPVAAAPQFAETLAEGEPLPVQNVDPARAEPLHQTLTSPSTAASAGSVEVPVDLSGERALVRAQPVPHQPIRNAPVPSTPPRVRFWLVLAAAGLVVLIGVSGLWFGLLRSDRSVPLAPVSAPPPSAPSPRVSSQAPSPDVTQSPVPLPPVPSVSVSPDAPSKTADAGPPIRPPTISPPPPRGPKSGGGKTTPPPKAPDSPPPLKQPWEDSPRPTTERRP